jgi:hypothetical protein
MVKLGSHLRKMEVFFIEALVSFRRMRHVSYLVSEFQGMYQCCVFCLVQLTHDSAVIVSMTQEDGIL